MVLRIVQTTAGLAALRRPTGSTGSDSRAASIMPTIRSTLALAGRSWRPSARVEHLSAPDALSHRSGLATASVQSEYRSDNEAGLTGAKPSDPAPRHRQVSRNGSDRLTHPRPPSPLLDACTALDTFASSKRSRLPLSWAERARRRTAAALSVRNESASGQRSARCFRSLIGEQKRLLVHRRSISDARHGSARCRRELPAEAAGAA